MGSSEIDIHYDREGNPIGTVEFAELFEDKDYQHVKSQVVHGFKVSTVWLGTDHSFGTSWSTTKDKPEPIIFETMIFGGDQVAPWDEYQARYSTERDALVGHMIICDMIAYHYTRLLGRHEWVKAKTPHDEGF